MSAGDSAARDGQRQTAPTTVSNVSASTPSSLSPSLSLSIELGRVWHLWNLEHVFSPTHLRSRRPLFSRKQWKGGGEKVPPGNSSVGLLKALVQSLVGELSYRKLHGKKKKKCLLMSELKMTSQINPCLCL